MTGDDAKIAVDCGVDAVWVSNHGGRQLDTLMATVSLNISFAANQTKN